MWSLPTSIHPCSSEAQHILRNRTVNHRPYYEGEIAHSSFVYRPRFRKGDVFECSLPCSLRLTLSKREAGFPSEAPLAQKLRVSSILLCKEDLSTVKTQQPDWLHPPSTLTLLVTLNAQRHPSPRELCRASCHSLGSNRNYCKTCFS